METITQKKIGQRISDLRKSKGYYQNDPAKMLDISRPSLTQIELGKRNLSVIEIKKITGILSISIDKLLSSDFNYYELYEEHLSGAEYRKLPYGPVPQKLDMVINQMIAGKQLKRIKTDYHGYPQTRYIPLSKPNLSNFTAGEKDVIDKVIDQYSDWTASAISDYSHKDMPWLATKTGEAIDYELAFYREAPYSVRNYDENEEAL